MPRYAIDSSVYIGALRDRNEAAELKSFLAASLASTFLSAVVALELRAGVRSAAHLEDYEAIVGPFARRGRVFAPSVKAYEECGRILADLANKDGVKLAETNRSFVNDILIAVSCRERGITLVAQNDADFGSIRRHLRSFQYVPPWPKR